MSFAPAFTLLRHWFDAKVAPRGELFRCPYEDFVEILSGILASVPVDDDWYLGMYPAVGQSNWAALGGTPGEHFQRHGYFEGRRPFEDGWHGLKEPPSFKDVLRRFRITGGRGQIYVEQTLHELKAVISALLGSATVDPDWYFTTYPNAAAEVRSGAYSGATDHYSRKGYFDNFLPHSIAVDDDWYQQRYEHVRNGLIAGVAKSPQDHFVRIGYSEGCRPVAP